MIEIFFIKFYLLINLIYYWYTNGVMILNNNTTDLSERDFPVNAASIANEMVITEQVSSIGNSESKDVLYGILDLDESIKSEDAEESDPEYPDEFLPEEMREGYYDEILLIEQQQQEEENAMIKGYPMPRF